LFFKHSIFLCSIKLLKYKEKSDIIRNAV